MRATTIEERFWRWVDCPSLDCFFLLRQAILQQEDSIDLDVRFWSELREQFETERYCDLLAVCDDVFHAACLSPRFHLYCGISAAECADEGRSRNARRAMQTLLASLLETGEGTVQSPFMTTYFGDMYDILQALSLKPVSQRIAECGDRRLDVIQADDGEEYCFDISALVGAGPAAAIRVLESFDSAG